MQHNMAVLTDTQSIAQQLDLKISHLLTTTNNGINIQVFVQRRITTRISQRRCFVKADLPALLYSLRWKEIISGMIIRVTGLRVGDCGRDRGHTSRNTSVRGFPRWRTRCTSEDATTKSGTSVGNISRPSLSDRPETRS